MIRLFIALVLTLLTLVQTIGQINQFGNPFIKNFSPSVIDAADRNWAIVQDRRGIIYIGNDDKGVLEYDGKTWRKIPIPNNSPVRSLAIDNRNVIYVGAVNEIGYLKPDMNGQLKYISLVSLISDENKDFGDVWKTHVIDETVYFSAGNHLFKYTQNEIQHIKNKENLRNLFSFVIEEELYVSSYIKGLMKLGTDTFQVTKNGEFFNGKSIFTMLPFSKNKLIITTNEGIYLYDSLTGEVSIKMFSKQILQNARESFIYHGIKLPDNLIAYATLYNGILLMNNKGELIEKYDKLSGLQDDMAFYLFHDSSKGREAPVWAALNTGISIIEINNPYRYFGEVSGLKGQITDIIRFDDILYIATPIDVFYYEELPGQNPKFVPLNIRFECWKFLEFIPSGKMGSKLLVGTSGGVFEINKNKTVTNITRGIRPQNLYTYALIQSKKNKSRVYLGLLDGLSVIQFDKGKWSAVDLVTDIKDEIRNIKEDQNGSIWLSTLVNGVIRLTENEEKYSIERFGEDYGFEILKDIELYEYDDRIVFATRNGIYRFIEDEKRFELDESFGQRFGDGSTGVFRFVKDKDLLWISGNEGNPVGYLRKNEAGEYVFINAPFRRMPQRSTPAILPDKDSIVWFGNANDLFSFNRKIPRDYNTIYQTLVRRITIGQDSLLFSGTYFRKVNNKNLITFEQPEEMKPVLKYALNNITFEFASPFFENGENIQYSFMLEGFSNIWSRWTPENKAVYTNLPEGDYIFKVKAINVFGIESVPGTYAFTVKPPWYRSVLAFIAYFILAALFVWGIVVINSRRLKREKIILEGIVRERTAEVVKQKDEIEKQRDMIAEQNKNITDSIEYARRIQTAILPPGDYIKELFPQRFILYLPRDIVSGDFYWLTQKNNQIISVAADCTGHGVPGGFMSMLGIAFLNEIVNKNEVLHANEILNQLREQVISSLHQTGKMGEAQDGMDVSLYILDHKKRKLEFSGANNPLIIIRDKEIIEIKGDKMPIGIHYRAEEPFSNHKVDLMEGDVVYSFTDGYPDQFGGRNGKKFLSKNFKELLLKIHDKPMNKQKEILEKTLLEWQGSFERVDDILVMGVKI